MYATLTITLLLWKQAYSLSIVDFQVPGHAEEGGSALLGCTFNLEGEELYSVNWFKDGKEFYRYVPSNIEPIRYFSIPGVVVNLSRSSSSVVALEQLQQNSAGLYRCEVSGEAPYFNTKLSEEKSINIHLLPKSGPRVTGIENDYQIGEMLEVNCSSGRSRPSAQIKWLVNDRPAPEHQRGPWERRSRERSDARDTILGLAFTLTPHHFQHGILKLKCQSAIAPLYQKEVIFHVLQAKEDEGIESFENFEKLHLYEKTLENDSLDITFTSKPDNELIAHDHGTTLELSLHALILLYIILQLLL